jgi:hypothetical protein
MFVVKALIAAIVAAGLLFAAQGVQAHCDGLDGRVVGAAQKALETGDVKRVLVWVRPQDSIEIRSLLDFVGQL